MSPYVSHVKTDILGFHAPLAAEPRVLGMGDLENAQTTVTVESTSHSSHHNLTLLPPVTMQCNKIPARVYLDFTIRGQTRAEVRVWVRSAGRRYARLRSAPYRGGGSVQCAAVRQIKPNHESCHQEITLHDLGYIKSNMIPYTSSIYNATLHTFKFVFKGKSLLEKRPDQFRKAT